MKQKTVYVLFLLNENKICQRIGNTSTIYGGKTTLKPISGTRLLVWDQE